MADRSGGQGGNVALIMGIFVFGYLYFSRRLPNVIKGLTTPAADYLPLNAGGGGGGGAAPPAPGAGGAPSGAPSGAPAPLNFYIYPPLGYSFAPIQITTTAAYCAETVYQAMLQATGSAAQAQIASVQYCFGNYASP